MKGQFFICDCAADGIYVEHHPDFGTEFALFCRDPHDRSWKNRLRLVWQCLKGEPYADMIILNDEKIADLVDYLVEIQNYKS